MFLFYFFSFSAIFLCLFASRSSNLRVVTILLFSLASFFRGAWGPDYATYFSIYDGSSEIGDSGSYLFDLFLRFTAYSTLDYQFLGLLSVLICFSWLLWLRKHCHSGILFLNSSFYSFFLLYSANINKTHLVLAILVGVVLPIIAFRKWESFALDIKSASSIWLILSGTICFLLQPAIAGFLLTVVAFTYFTNLFIVFVRLLALRRFSPALLIKFVLVLIVLLSPMFLVLLSKRFSEYSTSLVNPSFDYYNATQNSSALFHALPFIVFPVFLFLFVYPVSFNRSSFCQSLDNRSLSAWIKFCLPITCSFFIVVIFYFYCSMTGANPNLVGRTSIVYTLLAVYYFVSLPPTSMVLLLSSRAKFILMISSFLPLFLRAFSAIKYGLSV